jgi:anti-sigma B factor antagonist
MICEGCQQPRFPPGTTPSLQKGQACSNLSGHYCKRFGDSQHHLSQCWQTQFITALGRYNVEIEIRSLGEVKLLKLTGRLTLGDPVDRLRATIDDLMAAGDTRFVLDLAAVSMLDSSGIGLLVRSLTSLKHQGGDLKLLNPTKFAVQTLKMIGLLNLFEVFEERQDALASFK